MLIITKLILFFKKYKAILIIASVLTPIIQTIEKYIFNDWNFLKSLAVIVAIDTVLGIAKAFIAHSLSVNAFGKMIIKILVYMSVLICANVITTFQVDDKNVHTFSFIETWCYVALIAREASSIFRNAAILLPGFFSKKILKYLEDFDPAGNYINSSTNKIK